MLNEEYLQIIAHYDQLIDKLWKKFWVKYKPPVFSECVFFFLVILYNYLSVPDILSLQQIQIYFPTQMATPLPVTPKVKWIN
jgi:hypothetical protein